MTRFCKQKDTRKFTETEEDVEHVFCVSIKNLSRLAVGEFYG